MDPSGLEQDGFKFAKSAVELDQRGHYPEAIFYYKEAAEALRHAAVSGSKIDAAEKADEYMERVEELAKYMQSIEQGQHRNAQPKPPQVCQGEQRAKFLVKQALEQDEQGNEKEALELYMQAADLCLKTREVAGITQSSKKQLEALAKQALTRGEEIKAKENEASLEKKLAALPEIVNDLPSQPKDSKTNVNNTTRAKPKSPQPPRKPLGIDFNLDDDSSSSNHQKPNSSQSRLRPQNRPRAAPAAGGLTKEEIAVLRSTSFINNKEYVPFMSFDLKERFAFPMPFTDKGGLLELSDKQKKRLKSWMRPNEFAEEPQMIMAVSSFSIKQTVVSDCSFVASLAISAAYERRFRKKLITSIIFPQNKKGEPMYNPCGKYMVKLHLNGVPRKVIIDDLLPVDKYGELLCSYSSNKNELWVSLIEKAYMKVMGGYDFPGSNSNIDLHALTGWIPERQSLRDFDKNQFFDKILTRFHRGDCLATISTGPMTTEEEERTGLVATHAYAVLDIQKVQGLQMLQLKNPWSHLRWKGRFGAEDNERWTPKLRKALNYDNKLAQQYDNGVFWIDYDSALHFYDTFYVSWNPDLFPLTMGYHMAWMAHDGPEKDSYSLGNNPQYSLEVRNPQPSAVWVLLTRHITDKDDFAQNKEFITMLVYKNEGNKVYYPHSPPPHIDGIRINSPHYLTRITVPAAKSGPNRYTLVVSQYEKHKNIQYTVRVYSVAQFTLKQIENPYKLKKRVEGAWTKGTAGGCLNHKDTYKLNPIYQINLMQQQQGAIQVLIELRGPKTYCVGFDVTCVDTKTGDKPFKEAMSGNFRSGYSMLEMSLAPGVYNVIPCTFTPNQESPFFLDISSSAESTKIVKIR